jgi:16S rRNA (uracil1498-N3)-methyltransferase
VSPPWFHHDDLPGAGATLVLDGPEGRHAATVRRLRAGEPVVLTDGRGEVARATVTDVGRAELTLAVAERRRVAAPVPRVVVVQALPKGERSELAVELATEAGADVLVPWQAARCVARWSPEKAERGAARWRSVAAAAAKQSRRAWVPEVTAAHGTGAVARLLGEVDLALVLHEEAAEPLAGVPLDGVGSVALVVGPEGGIGDDELAALRDHAPARAVHLGPTVLRTSTAAAVALGALGVLTGRWADGPRW